MAAVYTKPGDVPKWADSSLNITEPNAAKKAEGWLFEEIHTSSYENWNAKLVGDWFKWINERFDDGTDENVFEIHAPWSGQIAINITSNALEVNNTLNGVRQLKFDAALNKMTGEVPLYLTMPSSFGSIPAIVGEGYGTGSGGEFTSGATGKGIVVNGYSHGVYATASTVDGYGVYGIAGGVSGYGTLGIGHDDASGGGGGASGIGGVGTTGNGGTGLSSVGGNSTDGDGGSGIESSGGVSTNSSGGLGAKFIGGNGATPRSGIMALAYGYSPPTETLSGAITVGEIGLYARGSQEAIRAIAETGSDGAGLLATGKGTGVGATLQGGSVTSGSDNGSRGLYSIGGNTVSGGYVGGSGAFVKGGQGSFNGRGLVAEGGDTTGVHGGAAIRLVPQTAIADGELEGDMIIDSATHTLQFFNGTIWKVVATV